MGQSGLLPIFYNAFFNSTAPAMASHTPLQPSTSTGNYNLPIVQDQYPYNIENQAQMAYTSLANIPADKWMALNTSVGGRLHADGVPFSRPCFTSYELNFSNETSSDLDGNSQQEECTARQRDYLSEAYRVDTFGSAMNPQWETCQATSQGCLMDWMNPANSDAFASPKICHQGSVSRYYIDVLSPSDVAAAFDFARVTGARIVIKNTGHDYKGRSYAPDSLSLWTHNLQQISYDPTFVPAQCTDTAMTPGLTVGAGVVFGKIYDYAEQNGITFVGGTDRTVGASGGWVQGGGHSLLSNTLGLGVDRALEFKIVTPNGDFLTVNACQNQDLFFALRGGGGGTFGVVMETTFRVEPRPISLRVAKITFPTTSDNWKAVIDIGVKNALKWSEEAWSGIMGSGMVLFTNPNLSLDEASASFQPFADFASSVNGTLVIEDSPTWLTFFNKYITGNPVGLPGTPASRLVPKRHFENTASQAALKDAILSGTLPAQFKQVLISCPVNYVPPTGATPEASDTSITEAWRSCLWSVVAGTFWNYATDAAGVQASYAKSTEAIRPLKELTPDGGAYSNEANVYEGDHTREFWGSNYPRLLSIKQKYDPEGLLDCWHCVGWKGPRDDRYSCMLSMDN